MRILSFLPILSTFTGLVLGQASQGPSSDPYACSANKPCKIGCCGKNNICGLGPDYCSAANCQNSCNAKSECDPGWGSQWSNKEACPLNVCCSKYGFCGTTEEFCGDAKVQPPSCPPGGTSASQKIIGYYEGWSTTRACQGINPEELLFGAYTHLNYAFAFINQDTFEVANMQDSDPDFMRRLTALKNYNPSLEVWISIGGWSMNDPDQPTAATFSTLAGSDSAQQAFFKSLLSFMATYGFDGVDIDWEYPVAPERSGNPADFQSYVSFLSNLRAALGSNGHRYGLTITLPSSYWYMQNFDIKSIEPIVDWFNVMTYDLHGTWDSTDPYIGAYVNAHTNLTEIDLTMDLLWRNNIAPEKVVMGMGFYGRSFTLSDPSCSSPGCPFKAGGNPGRCSASAGTLMFSEIQDVIANGAKVTTDTAAAVKIVTWDNDQWVSYDDQETLKSKMDYANGKCLGGVMVWAASTDDAKGTAIQALAGASGRTDFSGAVLAKTPGPNPGQCVWGECGTNCPSGLVPVTSAQSNQGPLGIELGCNEGSRFFCCPAANPPTCSWKGSPKFCGLLSKNRCSDSEVEVAAKTDGCWTGHQSLCCDKTGADSTLASCEWFGAAPICSSKSALTVILGFVAPLGASAFTFASYGCDKNSDKPLELTTGKQGEGGQKSCSFNGGFKSYCCSDPAPWTGCSWKTGNVKWAEWGDVLAGPIVNVFTSFTTDCKTGCDPGQVTVATDSFACRSGTYSFYCCDNPNGAPSPPPLTDVNLCPGPASLPGLNPNLEPDSSDSNVYIEAEQFDDDCTLPPYQSQPTKRDRIYAVRPHFVGYESNQTNYGPSAATPLTFDAGDLLVGDEDDSLMKVIPFDHRSPLVKRGARLKNAMRLCSPKGLEARLYSISYPSHTSLLKNFPKLAWNVANHGVCAVPAIIGVKTLDPEYDYVTEHVLEKQEFRNSIEWMMQGKTPLGNTLKAGAAPFQGLFDDNGLFQANWPKDFARLDTVKTYAGNIADSFMGLLGRTADPGQNNFNVDNLQVCDADFNRYKEFIVAGVDFIGKKAWAAYENRLDRVAILTDVIDTMSYRSQPDVVTSYKTTYDALSTLWGNFADLARQQGVANYDFKGAFQQVMVENLNAQVSATRTVFSGYLQPEIAWWTSEESLKVYAPTIVANIVSRLDGYSSDLNTLISLPVSEMTG